MFLTLSSLLRTKLSRYFARNGLKVRHAIENSKYWVLSEDTIILRAKHSYSMFMIRYGEETS